MHVLGGEDNDKVQKLIHVCLVLDSEIFPVLRAMRMRGVFISLASICLIVKLPTACF